MLQVFYMNVAKVHLDVVFVAMAIHVCCKCMFQIFHLFQTYVVNILSGYCICFSGYTHRFLTSIKSVSSIFRCMLQVFLCRCCKCCSCCTHMLQAYVVNVSTVSDVYCISV